MSVECCGSVQEALSPGRVAGVNEDRISAAGNPASMRLRESPVDVYERSAGANRRSLAWAGRPPFFKVGSRCHTAIDPRYLRHGVTPTASSLSDIP